MKRKPEVQKAMHALMKIANNNADISQKASYIDVGCNIIQGSSAVRTSIYVEVNNTC